MKKVMFILIGAVVLLLSSGVILANEALKYPNIYENVEVEGLPLGGMTKEAAMKIVDEKFKPGELTLKHEQENWNLNFEAVGFSTEVEKAVNKAYEVGRGGNFVERTAEIVQLKMGKKIDIEVETKEDWDKVKGYVEQVSAQIDQAPSDAKISIGGSGGIVIVPETTGYSVDRTKLFETIKDAYEKNNVDFVEVPVKVTKAEVTQEFLSSINGILGEFSTKYNAGVAGRAHNISLAASKINGKILKPGEEFSFNNTTGKTGVSQGFKNAPVIVKGKLEDGIGGGVCQVSSTLYNAALYAGMDITSRRNHSIPSAYVPHGRDATVYYGSIDFRFKNPYNHPIYVQAYGSGGYMVAKIYGNSGDKKHIELSTERTGTVPQKIEYKNDPTLEVGKEKVESAGGDGIKVTAYRTFIENGQRVKTEVLSRDSYPPRAKIILRGTKPVQATVQPQAPAAPVASGSKNHTSNQGAKNASSEKTTKKNDTAKQPNLF